MGPWGSQPPAARASSQALCAILNHKINIDSRKGLRIEYRDLISARRPQPGQKLRCREGVWKDLTQARVGFVGQSGSGPTRLPVSPGREVD
jgi:hypothetical protein